MKFKRSYSNARNLGSAYKFSFGGDINRAYNVYMGTPGPQAIMFINNMM